MRHLSLTTCFSGALSLLALLLPVTAAAQGKRPALAIFDAALAAFENQRIALGDWQYHQTLITHQMDSAGNIVAKGIWQSIVRPGDPRPLEYTASRVEGKLSFFKAQTSSSAAPSGAKATKAPEEKNQTESAVEAVRKYNLRDRYNWKRLPDGNVAGESAYVISFEPKPRQNTKSREERFFGLLAGRIWISRSDYSVLKAEAALQSPCHLFWIIARVTTFQFTYNLEPAHGGPRLFRTSRATAKTVVTFPLFAIRQQHWLTADKFERRSPRGVAPKNPSL
jgi:hypothetical protein